MEIAHAATSNYCAVFGGAIRDSIRKKQGVRLHVNIIYNQEKGRVEDELRAEFDPLTAVQLFMLIWRALRFLKMVIDFMMTEHERGQNDVDGLIAGSEGIRADGSGSDNRNVLPLPAD